MSHFVGQTISADEAMKLALETAKKGLGCVSPNPPVGCVIVDRNHRFLSCGAHLKWGAPHAEINALNQIQDISRLKEASIYVTLEPCAHEGKTGSCARTLTKFPVKRFFYGLIDPHPEVSGKGLEILKAHNKEVIHFKKYEPQCEKLCEQFLFRVKYQKPFVALKVGASLDGKVALKNGESQWITNEKSRKFGRKLRAYYDATFIGAGTVLSDNPALDFRDTEFEGKKKNRIILFDPKGKLPEIFSETKISKIHNPENIFVISPSKCVQAWSKKGIYVIPWIENERSYSETQSKKKWDEIFQELYKKNLISIFVEGGPQVFGQILQWNLAQKIYLFESPKILGSGLSWTRFFENKKLSQIPSLKSWEIHNFGEDKLRILYF